MNRTIIPGYHTCIQENQQGVNSIDCNLDVSSYMIYNDYGASLKVTMQLLDVPIHPFGYTCIALHICRDIWMYRRKLYPVYKKIMTYLKFIRQKFVLRQLICLRTLCQATSSVIILNYIYLFTAIYIAHFP